MQEQKRAVRVVRFKYTIFWDDGLVTCVGDCKGIRVWAPNYRVALSGILERARKKRPREDGVVHLYRLDYGWFGRKPRYRLLYHRFRTEPLV